MNIRGLSLLVGLLVAVPATVSEAQTRPSALAPEVSTIEQVMVGGSDESSRSAERVATREQATEFSKLLSAGEEHTCVLDDGAVYCWGENSSGQLGLGDTSARGDDPNEMGDGLQAIDLGSGRSAKAIEAGGFHNCALLDDDSVKCWGDNSYGQLVK